MMTAFQIARQIQTSPGAKVAVDLVTTPQTGTKASSPDSMPFPVVKSPVSPLAPVCDQMRIPLKGIGEHLSCLSNTRAILEAILQSDAAKNIRSDVKTHLMQYLELQKASLETLKESEQHQAVIINDMEDFSQLEAGLLKLNISIIEPKKILKHALEILKTQIMSKKLKISISDEALFQQEEVMGDKVRLQQILLNLLSNAIKFTPQAGTIRIVFHEPKTDNDSILLKFSIEDSGIGMTKSQIESLFKPYKQASTEICSQYGGTGLGLWISKYLIALMGGEIAVKSPKDNGGAGSIFTFTIKCKAVQLKSQPPSPTVMLSNSIHTPNTPTTPASTAPVTLSPTF